MVIFVIARLRIQNQFGRFVDYTFLFFKCPLKNEKEENQKSQMKWPTN